MLMGFDGLWTLEPWIVAESGYEDSLQVCVAFPAVLKQCSAGAQVGRRARLSPRHQAVNSILSSGYFYEEHTPSPTLAKSVSARDGFKLQPNLASPSHTVFFQKPVRTWQAKTETADSQYPSDWLPWLRRPSIPVAASLGREIISGGRQLGGGWGEL